MTSPVYVSLSASLRNVSRPLARASGLPLSALGLLLLACNGRLAVLDPPLDTANGGSAGGGADGVANAGATQLPERLPEGGSGGAAGSDQLPADAGPDDMPLPPDPDPTDIACSCGTSEGLQALGCASASYVAAPPFMSDDASLIVYDLCFDTAGNPDCKPYVWTLATGPQPLPDIPARSTVLGLSANGGLVLIGPPNDGFSSAIVYRVDDGLAVSTGLLPESAVMGSDGSVVGLTRKDNDSVHLARWTRGETAPRAGSLQVLGDLPFSGSQVGIVSTPSQAVIAGVSYTNPSVPFRWTEAGGVEVGLQGLPEVVNTLSLSRDGSVLAGYRPGAGGNVNQMYWTQAGGAVDLGVMNSSFSPRVVPSADGSVIAGTSFQDPDLLCFDPTISPCLQRFGTFRWTQQTGAVALTPGISSYPNLMSADGSLILGTSLEGYIPFYWNAQHGARGLQMELGSAGADISGWTLGEARALSSDGRVVAGYGRCGGRNTIYRAVLPE